MASVDVLHVDVTTVLSEQVGVVGHHPPVVDLPLLDGLRVAAVGGLPPPVEGDRVVVDDRFLHKVARELLLAGLLDQIVARLGGAGAVDHVP